MKQYQQFASRIPPSHVHQHVMAGCLVVTEKKYLPLWEKCVREVTPLSSLHMYVGSLASRRKYGTYHLTGLELVVTTFDVNNNTHDDVYTLIDGTISIYT